MNLPHDAKVWCPCCLDACSFSIETPRPDANGVWGSDLTCDACHLVIATFHCAPDPAPAPRCERCGGQKHPPSSHCMG